LKNGRKWIMGKPILKNLNFSYEEVQRVGFPLNPTAKQVFLLEHLFKQIQNVKDVIEFTFSQHVPFRVTDCYRTVEKYQDMKNRGLYPSATSDHFWGQHIPVSSASNLKKYGPIYEFSTGAADIVPSIPGIIKDECNRFRIFETIVQLDRSEDISLGQVIYEKSVKTGTEWIHVSNPIDLIYNSGMIDKLNLIKSKYLTTKDGGRTYQVYS